MFVIFDQQCAMCRFLAGVMRKRSLDHWSFISFEQFELLGHNLDLQDEHGQQLLGVWDGKTLYKGQAAWEKILELHPDFKSLLWIARILGLERSKLASAVERTGHVARRLCRSCPSRLRRR